LLGLGVGLGQALGAVGQPSQVCIGRRLREQLGSLLEALRFGVPLCGEVTLGDSHTRHLAYEQARPVGEFPFTAEDLRRTKNESAFADYSIYCQSSGTFMAERASDSGEGFRVGDGPAFLPRSPPPSPSPPNTDCDSASECARARAAACAHRAGAMSASCWLGAGNLLASSRALIEVVDL